MSDKKSGENVVSGMRPTGLLHLGHYHGALKNWVTLQEQHSAFFFVADWHALTTNYEAPKDIHLHTKNMLIDWLSVGIDPEKAVVFRQSDVLEHAELHILLSMVTPVSWLYRVPTYKGQQEKLSSRDLSTYGFLGYPLLQTADVLLYDAALVPVGEDQVPHIELSREIARRFNHLFRRAHANVEEVVDVQATLQSKEVLREPTALLTKAARIPGVDGQKMSKSYGNAIDLSESAESTRKKIRQMMTDPARARRSDPGDPERCPFWVFHEVYSDEQRQNWARAGCRSASIGCLECKAPVMEAVLAEQEVFFDRAQRYRDRPELLDDILADGAVRAKSVACQTMERVREAMGLYVR